MELSRADPVPGHVEAAAVADGLQPEWLEIIRSVSVPSPDQPSELWLGQLVMEVQEACDRAISTARRRADIVIDEARSEALGVRQAGRRRAESIEWAPALVHGASWPQSSSSVSPGDYYLPAPPSATVAPGASVTANGAVTGGPSLPDVDAAAAVMTGHHRRWATGARFWAAAVVSAVAVLLVIVGFIAFEHYVTAAQERGAQQHLASALVTAEASRVPVARPVHGAGVGFLDVPRLAIKDVSVVEGATLANLRRGPAHDATSRLAGQSGAIVIMGHRRTYGGPFARLNELRTGDTVDIKAPSGIYVYRVFGPPRIVHGGPGAVLRLPTADQVEASGGPAGPINETLILATGADSGGASFEVVMATLVQGATVSNPLVPNSNDGGAQLRPIPGDWVGLPLAWLWIGVVGGTLYLGRRFRTRLGAPWMMYLIVTWCALVALYQLYGGIDRVLPGTY